MAPAPPRQLPPQDHEAIASEEAQARRFTALVGTAALVVAMMVAALVVVRLSW